MKLVHIIHVDRKSHGMKFNMFWSQNSRKQDNKSLLSLCESYFCIHIVSKFIDKVQSMIM